MKTADIFRNTFQALRQKISPTVRQQVALTLPSMPMVEACRANDFDFFRPFLDTLDLTPGQMHHASEQYHLGKTKTGTPIFWLIDEMLQPLDAHIGSSWISAMLKKREPLLEYWTVRHCLFGLHLLTDGYCHTDLDKNICVVESEASAVVLSALFPESIWMAYSTTSHLLPEFFAPLEGRVVTIFPRTDPTLSTYLFFLDFADQLRRLYDINLTVDNTLDDHATPDQKERCIDILEFLSESPQSL